MKIRRPRRKSASPRRSLARSFEPLESRHMMHHGGEDLDIRINNYQFEMGPDFEDSSTLGDASLALAPLSAIPVLNSFPGAPVTLYLDFDGDYIANWGSHSNITTPVFDLDGDPTTFNSAELTSIDRIWQRVSEDFAPFNINVTTVDPGAFLNGVALKVAIGGGGGWLGTPAGGVAYVDNFTSAVANVVFVFPDALGRNEKNIAEAASHEAGHAFGLEHQSTFDANGIKLKEYNPGGNGWAPIMGNSYSQPLSTWSYGPSSPGAQYLQDDLAVMAKPQNNFGFRTDDHANTSVDATPLVVTDSSVFGSGIIETMTDADVFSFVTDSGLVTLSANVAPLGANLDAILELYDVQGSLVAIANPSGSLSATISMQLPAGFYTALVRSTGNYGYIGQYTLTGTINTGMFVADHTPAETDVVDTPPTAFTITLSEPYDPATVEAGDLLVNGIPANSFSLVDAQTIAFQFLTSPVSNEGLQSMTMAPGALARLIDGDSSKPFAGSFRYDTERLAVTSIVPASVSQLPLSTITVHFNQPISAGTVSASDLTLSRGNVVDVSFLDASTLEFAVTGLIDEGPLTLSVAAGALADAEGNPGLAYSTTITLDYGLVSYPATLVPIGPEGSLIYDPAISGTIGQAGDLDQFTIALPAGQTLTAVLKAEGGLVPLAEIIAPGGSSLGSLAGLTAGADIVLGPVSTVAAGLYTVRVSGLAGSTGAYSLQLVVNAAVERESVSGQTNHSIVDAQNIDASFIAVGSLERGAVLGRTDLAAGLLPVEIELNNSRATASVAARNFAAATTNLYQLGITGTISPSTDSDWIRLGVLDSGDRLTVTMSGSAASRGTLSDPQLELWRGSSASPVLVTQDADSGPGSDALINGLTITDTDVYYLRARPRTTQTGTYQLGVWLENTGLQPLTGGTVTSAAESNNSAATANDASSSWRPVQYLSETAGEETLGDIDYFQFTFTAGDLVTFEARTTSGNADQSLAIYNSSGTLMASENGSSTVPNSHSYIYSFIIPSTGTYYARVLPTAGTGTYTLKSYLSTNTPPPAPTPLADVYAFTASAGQVISAALAEETGGQVSLELRDAADSIIAVATTQSSNVSAAIKSFTMPANGTYYLVVNGDANLDYSLIVTRNGVFDFENAPLAEAPQDLTQSASALGSLNAIAPLPYGQLSFSVDTANSYIAIGGLVGDPVSGLAILPQTPGSLTAHYAGTVAVNRTPDHVSFDGGTQLEAIAQPGPFLPGGGPAEYAGIAEFAPGIGAVATFNNIAFDITSALLSPALADAINSAALGGSGFAAFPANSVLFTLTEGEVAYDALGFADVLPIAGLALNNQFDGSATLEEIDGVLHLTIPLSAQAALTVPDLNLPVLFTFTGQLVATFVIPGPADPTDEYEVHLEAGQTLTLETDTPLADGMDVGQNLLDPALALYAPGGAQVAADDNSRPDGVNARLQFTATDAGVYRIVVNALGAGDYVLTRAIGRLPQADAGGPYNLEPGSPLHLDASESSDPDGDTNLTYTWDVNGDGIYGDATGVKPTLSAAQLATLGIKEGQIYSPTVRVTDSTGLSSDAVTTLTVAARAPRVIGVSVANDVGGFYEIPAGDGEQLRTVPVAQIQYIAIQFSEPVDVEAADLTLPGTGVTATLAIFNIVTNTATFQLSAPLSAGAITLRLDDSVTDAIDLALDGEWENPTGLADPDSSEFPSGNGTAGGDFEFHFRVLPGDINRDGAVNGADYVTWAANFKQFDGNATWSDGDVSGDGHVDGIDYIEWARYFTPAAASAPVVSAALPVTPEIPPTVLEEEPAPQPSAQRTEQPVVGSLVAQGERVWARAVSRVGIVERWLTLAERVAQARRGR